MDVNTSPKGSQWNERTGFEQWRWLQHCWLCVHFRIHTKDIVLKRQWCYHEAYVKYERGVPTRNTNQML